MMPPLEELLFHQIEPEPVLRTGWLDPFFLVFIVACAAQLFVFVWLLATDVDPKVGDDASHVRDTPPGPMPEAPVPSPPSEASTALHDQERSPAQTSELQSPLVAFRPEKATPHAARQGRARTRSVYVSGPQLPPAARARTRRSA